MVAQCGAENLGLTADTHNWIHGPGTDYQYDADGNMTYDATANLNYNFDQENRITGAGGYGYIYDGDGNRVEKVTPPINPTSGTLYWYMTPGIVAESDLNGNLKSEYVFFDGERVARKDFPGNTVAYYFSDHLKTASIITDSAGNIKADSDYYPWGGELQFVANDSNHYKFTGKERDGETGLDYFGARYYSNGLGRWVSADWSATPVPVPYADFEDPQTLNQYSYVRNTPTVKVDANGHCFWDVCVGETIVVVTAITATAAYLSTPSGQNALKAAVHIFDKATDALAAGGNALAAGCAGSGTCLTGMKPPGGPPEYYQQMRRRSQILNSKDQLRANQVRLKVIKAVKAQKRLDRILILMKVVRHMTVKEIEQDRKILVNASKSRLAISTRRLNSSLQLMIEKPSKMNLEGLTRTADPIPVLIIIRFSPPARNIANKTVRNND